MPAARWEVHCLLAKYSTRLWLIEMASALRMCKSLSICSSWVWSWHWKPHVNSPKRGYCWRTRDVPGSKIPRTWTVLNAYITQYFEPFNRRTEYGLASATAVQENRSSNMSITHYIHLPHMSLSFQMARLTIELKQGFLHYSLDTNSSTKGLPWFHTSLL